MLGAAAARSASLRTPLRTCLQTQPLASLFLVPHRFATKKQASSVTNKKDNRKGRRLGVKRLGRHATHPGDVLVRQRGTVWHAGDNVYMGKDHTLHAAIEGHVRFEKRLHLPHARRRKWRKFVHVQPKSILAPLLEANRARQLEKEKIAQEKAEREELLKRRREWLPPVISKLPQAQVQEQAFQEAQP